MASEILSTTVEELVELKCAVETSANAERGFNTMNVIILHYETGWACSACQTFSS